MSGALTVSGGTVLSPDGWIEADVLVEDGRIVRVAQGGRRPREAAVVPARGARVLPGLIDLQVNGAFGRSFASASPAEIAEAARGLARFGVTGFLATIISLPIARMAEALTRLREAAEGDTGPQILGAHLEGPFLNPERAGAHKRSHILKPSLADFTKLAAAGGNFIRMMTVAPEMKGAVSLIAAGVKRGMVMSIGHSAAARADVEEAVRDGATAVTHLYNSMAPFHHRQDNIVSAALLDDRLTCGIIYDGHHVGRAAAEVALRCKPRGRLMLVSDSTAALGMRDGPIEIDGTACVVQGGRVLVRGTETLAGSAEPILEGVRRLVEDRLLPLDEAWRLASAVPARVLGLEKTKGRIAPGCDGDLVVLDDRWQVRAAFAGGRRIHGDHHQG